MLDDSNPSLACRCTPSHLSYFRYSSCIISIDKNISSVNDRICTSTSERKSCRSIKCYGFVGVSREYPFRQPYYVYRYTRIAIPRHSTNHSFRRRTSGKNRYRGRKINAIWMRCYTLFTWVADMLWICRRCSENRSRFRDAWCARVACSDTLWDRFSESWEVGACWYHRKCTDW